MCSGCPHACPAPSRPLPWCVRAVPTLTPPHPFPYLDVYELSPPPTLMFVCSSVVSCSRSLPGLSFTYKLTLLVNHCALLTRGENCSGHGLTFMSVISEGREAMTGNEGIPCVLKYTLACMHTDTELQCKHMFSGMHTQTHTTHAQTHTHLRIHTERHGPAES